MYAVISLVLWLKLAIVREIEKSALRRKWRALGFNKGKFLDSYKYLVPLLYF